MLKDQKEQGATAKGAEPLDTEIPERFLNPQTSDIMVNVEQNSNRIDIDLND